MANVLALKCKPAGNRLEEVQMSFGAFRPCAKSRSRERWSRRKKLYKEDRA